MSVGSGEGIVCNQCETLYIQGRSMSGWTAKEPGDAYPLRETEACHETTVRNDREHRGGDAVASGLGSPPPLSFIFPREFPDNPYAMQPAYNPSYKPIAHAVPEQTRATNKVENVLEKVEKSEKTKTPTSSAADNCIAYCLAVVIVAAFIAAIGSLIYLSIRNPTKVARLLYNVTNEAKNSQDDEDKPLYKKTLDPVVAKIMAKYINPFAASGSDQNPRSRYGRASHVFLQYSEQSEI